MAADDSRHGGQIPVPLSSRATITQPGWIRGMHPVAANNRKPGGQTTLPSSSLNSVPQPGWIGGMNAAAAIDSRCGDQILLSSSSQQSLWTAQHWQRHCFQANQPYGGLPFSSSTSHHHQSAQYSQHQSVTYIQEGGSQPLLDAHAADEHVRQADGSQLELQDSSLPCLQQRAGEACSLPGAHSTAAPTCMHAEAHGSPLLAREAVFQGPTETASAEAMVAHDVEPAQPPSICVDCFTPGPSSPIFEEARASVASSPDVRVDAHGRLYDSQHTQSRADVDSHHPVAGQAVAAVPHLPQPDGQQAGLSAGTNTVMLDALQQMLGQDRCKQQPPSMSLNWLLHADLSDEAVKSYLMKIAGKNGQAS